MTMKNCLFLVLILSLSSYLFGFDNLTPEFPPTFQPGPFPFGTETVRNDAPVDETDNDGILHEYTAYKGTVVVDGVLDDAEWAKIPWTMMEFNFDIPTSEDGSLWSDTWAPANWDAWEDLTAWFKVLHDDNNIYVAFLRYDDNYSFDPATHDSPSNIWQNDAYQLVVDSRFPGAYEDSMPGAEVGVCLVDGEEAYQYWSTTYQNPSVELSLADGDCGSTITTATDKAIHGVQTDTPDGYQEVMEMAFVKYPDILDDSQGMLSVCALDRDYDIRESVNQWAQGIYSPKDNTQYGSILFSSASAPESAVESKGTVPMAFSLEQNYPNPFNPVTTISFELAKPENVTLKVFTLTGKEVATLLNNELRNAGAYQVSYDASQLESGVYLYQLRTQSGTLVNKMTLVR
jgi:hypothetical protein